MEVIEDNKKVVPAPTDTTKKPSKSKKDLPAPTDKPNENQNININNNVNNSIPQKQDNDTRNFKENDIGNNLQNNADIQEEINYEKIAYENLKDYPIFQKLPEAAKQARIKNENNKIKILGLYS